MMAEVRKQRFKQMPQKPTLTSELAWFGKEDADTPVGMDEKETSGPIQKRSTIW